MKYIYLALNWMFGVLFLLLGLLVLFYSLWTWESLIAYGAFCLIAASALLLPPTRRFFYSKINREIPTKARAISIFIFVVTFGVLSVVGEVQIEQRSKDQRAEERARELERTAPQRAAESRRFAAESRTRRIESQFSGWNGSHRNLERTVKRSMNNPRSYRHVSTTYSDRGDHLIVQMSYRGENVFGATITNTVRAKVSLDGDVLQVF